MVTSELRVQIVQFLLHSLSVVNSCWLTNISYKIFEMSCHMSDGYFGNASSPPVCVERARSVSSDIIEMHVGKIGVMKANRW